MTNSISFQHILTNQISIPNALLMNYNTLGMDETEVMVLIQIYRFKTFGNNFPTLHELTSLLTIDENACSKILRKLIQKNLLAIERLENDQHQLSEAYSLEPLWKILFQPAKKEQPQSDDGSLFILFEQEFGRPLSPFEIETVNVWLDEDKVSPALIKAALRESVLMGKLNFKYIDRILRDWKKKGIHSVEQAREATKRFHDNQAAKYANTSTSKKDSSLYYNWLEGED